MTEIPENLLDYEAVRPLSDGQWLCLMKLTFNRMRLIVAPDEWTAGEHW
jgi:hypothetical protein